MTNRYISEADFSGADSAKNILTGIQVSWTAVNPAKNVIGYRVYRFSLNTPKMIAFVDPNTLSYIDGSIVSGSKYQYMVRAIDPSYGEDGNNKRVDTIAWAGLNSVVSNTNDTITVNFDNKLQGIVMRLLLEGAGKQKIEVARIATQSQIEAGSYTITKWPDNVSLKPGASYNVYAELYEPGGQNPDGNNKAYPINTKSYSFDGFQGGLPGWNSVGTVRAFGRSPASQGSSAFGNGTEESLLFIPTNRAQVDIGFLPFTLPAGFPSNLYRYVIYRMGESKTIDTSNPNIASCPTAFNASTSLEPCIIKNNIHPTNDLTNGLFILQDTSVWTTGATTAEKPPRYRYMMSLKHLDAANSSAGYVEKLPMARLEAFSILTPIPPNEMVLVNRESANFEFCMIQKSLRSDPLNHNRCSNHEVGSRPLNSGPGRSPLNLEEGFYDFGYNLFVDRYPLACNNDIQDEGTFYTTYSTATNKPYGSTLSSVLPSGEVAYVVRTGQQHSNCYYRSNTSSPWLRLHDFETQLGSGAAEAFRKTLTNTPDANRGKPKFSFPYWNAPLANLTCEAFSETGYGPKRVPRMREFRAFAAPPFSKRIGEFQTTDLYHSRVTAANAVESTVALPWTKGGCLKASAGTYINAELGPPPASGNINSLFTSANINQFSYLESAGVPSGPPSFFIGAAATSDCVSKYGVADINETPSMDAHFNRNGFNTVWWPASDYFMWSPNTITGSTDGILKGLVSPLDSGNVDASYDISGPQTGFLSNVLSASHTTSAPDRFNLSLGIPVLSTQQGSDAYAQNRVTADNYNRNILSLFPSSISTGYYAMTNSRYSTSYEFGDSVPTRVRCVLPAD